MSLQTRLAALASAIGADIKKLSTIAYAENLAEGTTTATGTFVDLTGGGVGPSVSLVVPTGGRFVDLQAECQAKHSSNNTDGIWFVLLFAINGAGFTAAPAVGYDTPTPYPDTTGNPSAIGAAMWYADAVYRPLRLGQGRTPMANGTSSFLFPSASRIWLPAGSHQIKMGYGLQSGHSGTAYFKSRRLRAQVLPH